MLTIDDTCAMIEMQSESDNALNEKRRAKMEEIISTLFDGSGADFARHIGKSDARVSQWRTGVRNISTKTAMLIERLCKTKPGVMVDPRGSSEPDTGPFEVLMDDLGDDGAQMTLNFLQFQVNTNAAQLGPEKTAHYLAWIDRIIEANKKRGKKWELYR